MAYSDEVLADSPIGYWRCGETSGTTLTDEVSSLDLTLTGADPNVSGPDNLGSAVFLDGVDDEIRGDVFSYSGVVTMECWFRAGLTSQPNWGRICEGESGGDGIRLQRHSGNDALRVGVSTSVDSVSVDTADFDPFDDTWHHAVVVADGTDLTLYVDKTQRATTTYSAGTGVPLRFVEVAVSNKFLGYVDEIAFYDSALSKARIDAHYDAATASGTTVTPGVLGLSATLPASTPVAPATSTPSTTDAALTIPAASSSGSGVSTPAATSPALDVHTPSPTGPASTSPAVTDAVLSVPAASPASPGSPSPSAISRSVVIPQSSPTGAGNVTPAASELAANIHAVTTATGGAGTVTPDELVAQLSLAQASPVGAANVTPAALSAALAIPAVDAEGLTLVSPAALETAVSLGQVSLVGAATVTVDALELEVVFGVPVTGEAIDHPTGKTSVTLDASTTDAGVVASITSVTLAKSRTFITLDESRTDT